MRTDFRNRRRAVCAAFFCIVLSLHLSALSIPQWIGPVNDQAGVMSAAEKNELSGYLTDLNNQTGVQMAVLTVPSLGGASIEELAIRTADAWKLGQADTDNGALLVVALEERELRIEVGYGLESVLTDAKSGLIIRNVITPYFRDGKYGAGIIAGIKNMAGIATDNAELVSESVQNGDTASDAIGAAAFFFIVFIVIVTAGVSTSIRGRRYGRYRGPIIMPPPTFRSRNDSDHHFGGGFGGFGGFGGGGGFSGGGGGFGGGGASGRW
ncbi:TPM domain-containing protein [Treponema brennaborense]|uniref:TPM domain-containing protein n=1 Tax=Treponema brennaborense (strain DSM 12168 / CIP 105900 / DD5/3) TaxID=906968 RepID=F4LMF8_TREBD|nr:TPM domain-containing protein [Treponema brennaborense]AEE15720.1 protein of unknown function DUF477 [Treponema brennaborense DSM 12168]